MNYGNRFCIYCKNTHTGLFSGREHVIPQAFGTFGTLTPTLRCVCDECNAYFAKFLDQMLARETLEGVTRYKNNKFSSENRPQKRLRFTLKECEEVGDFGGAVVEGVDPTTGDLLPVVTQLQIKNRTTGKTDVFFLRGGPIQISEEDHDAPGKRELMIYAPSKEEHDEFVEELRQAGVPVRGGEPFLVPEFLRDARGNIKPSLSVRVEGVMDDTHRRALAKIFINFSACYVGLDEVRQPPWEPLKRFVRYGEGQLGARFSEKPFWSGQETDEMRFANDSINIRVENHEKGLLGAIQFYNHPTYELLLIEDYWISPSAETAFRFTPGLEPIPGQRGFPTG